MIAIVQQILQLVLAVALGALLGAERELAHKPAGLRTHMLVSLGACAFTIVSIENFEVDPARVAAAVVAGIGFIGAGTMIAEREKVVGVTTAASLWITAAAGLATGAGNIALAVVLSVLGAIVLSGKRMYHHLHRK